MTKIELYNELQNVEGCLKMADSQILELRKKKNDVMNDFLSLLPFQKGDLVHHKDSDNVWMTDFEKRLTSPIDPSTICQFTGLKDCKGNEIWEHDLLQSRETRAIYEVVWDENGGFIIKNSVGGGHLLNFLGSILSVFNFKVVGNKFDKEK